MKSDTSATPPVGEKAGQQHGGVGQIELLLARAFEHRRELEAAAAPCVEQRGEYRGRVELRRHMKSIEPSVPTSATVERSPMTPWFSIGR